MVDKFLKSCLIYCFLALFSMLLICWGVNWFVLLFLIASSVVSSNTFLCPLYVLETGSASTAVLLTLRCAHKSPGELVTLIGILIQWVWSGAREDTFQINSQVRPTNLAGLGAFFFPSKTHLFIYISKPFSIISRDHNLPFTSKIFRMCILKIRIFSYITKVKQANSRNLIIIFYLIHNPY